MISVLKTGSYASWKQLLVVLFVSLSFSGFSQKMRFKVENQSDTTVFLIKYYGKNLVYADTAEMKKGIVEFDGKKQKPGILGLLLPGQKYFEFIYNNEEVHLETSKPDFITQMKVKKSVENTIFFAYIQMINDNRKKATNLSTKRDALDKSSTEYAALTEEIKTISTSVLDYQKNLIATHSDKLVGKIVKMSMDIEIPETPKEEKGKPIDSLFAYLYFRTHFWDNIDLKDDRLVNTPVLHSKLEYYFGQNMLVQHPDTIVKFAYDFVDRLDQKSEMFKYSVVYITSTFEKSKIIGMDKVFVRMGQKYYCSRNAEGKSPAYWMEEDKLKDLCEKVETNKNLVFGIVPPNISLRDTSDTKWKDFYSIKADYTILYFWDPECGHCKKTTPKLEKLYSEKLKARNVEVFAVSKAIGDEFGKWKKFIKDNKLSFINVGLTDRLYRDAVENATLFVPKYTTLEALNFHDTYDLYATPKIFVLDKDKKIISKSLSISQLEDFLDRMQNIPNPIKLIPEDKTEEAH
jgi:thiol-disulfide isomerase/thioredoxin